VQTPGERSYTYPITDRYLLYSAELCPLLVDVNTLSNQLTLL